MRHPGSTHSYLESLERHERSMSIQNHIYFFTVDTLKQLLQRNGFHVSHFELVGRTLTLDRLFYNIGLISHSRCLKRWMVGLGSALRFDRVRIHLNLKDMQRQYSRKIVSD